MTNSTQTPQQQGINTQPTLAAVTITASALAQMVKEVVWAAGAPDSVPIQTRYIRLIAVPGKPLHVGATNGYALAQRQGPVCDGEMVAHVWARSLLDALACFAPEQAIGLYYDQGGDTFAGPNHRDTEFDEQSVKVHPSLVHLIPVDSNNAAQDGQSLISHDYTKGRLYNFGLIVSNARQKDALGYRADVPDNARKRTVTALAPHKRGYVRVTVAADLMTLEVLPFMSRKREMPDMSDLERSGVAWQPAGAYSMPTDNGGVFYYNIAFFRGMLDSMKGRAITLSQMVSTSSYNQSVYPGPLLVDDADTMGTAHALAVLMPMLPARDKIAIAIGATQ